MPSKGTNNRYKASLDTEVADKIIAFERNLYQYVDAVMPKKRKYTLVTACEERVMMARELIVEGMDYDIRFYASDKHKLLTVARSKLRNVSIDLCHLNDTNCISDTAKAKFDEELAGILTQLAKLLNSLAKRIDLANLS